MSNTHHSHTEGEYIPETYIPHAESHGTKSLWRTFWLLLAITIVDFIIYFVADPSLFRNIVFIVFGIVKAFFIVGIFMHLNYEAKFMRWMIILPAIVFLSYLVWLLMIEGNYVSLVKYF
ncbi:MAG: cytochrome C oxidase subunit IV family protein [Bacteroidota bacterium]|jgi:cytochrome c oxidase subunit IV|nr:cytochrome C oxidase subunit IV family protein [Bacteroidota bacterium]